MLAHTKAKQKNVLNFASMDLVSVCTENEAKSMGRFFQHCQRWRVQELELLAQVSNSAFMRSIMTLPTGWSKGLVSIGKRHWQWQDFDGHHNKVTHQTSPSFLNIKVHNFVAFLNLLHQKGDESSRKEQGLEVLMGCDWRPLDSWGRNVLAEVKFSFWSQVG